MELIFHPEAAEEAAAARVWYEERSTRAAESFAAELKRGFDLLQEAPVRWPADGTGIRTMRLRKFPYAIVYALGIEQVNVLAVAHLHRRPGYWRNRVGDGIGTVLSGDSAE